MKEIIRGQLQNLDKGLKKMSKCIVTGGCGFIGSHVVDALVNKGHDVLVIDNQSAECNEEFFTNDNAHYCLEDIEDLSKIGPLFADAEYVFHLAAESRIQPTLERPSKACSTNFVGTCNVLQAAKYYKIKRVVYSSTSSCYGLKHTPPLVEEMERDCLNPYSVSKVAAEDLCKMYYTLWGLETVILRYFNVYGERQPLKGQYAPVIGIFQRQQKNGDPLTVVGDGTQRRDFTHVSDVVQANLLAAQVPHEETNAVAGEIFNVGTGSNHSVLEIAKLVLLKDGREVGGTITHIPLRTGEAQTTLANINKIKTRLGYEPKVGLEKWITDQQ